MMRINSPGVVPANAGTHTPRIFGSNAVLQQSPLSYTLLGLWVPAFEPVKKSSGFRGEL
jgi:hypothetical protein